MSKDYLKFIKDEGTFKYVCDLQSQLRYENVYEQLRHITNPKIIQLILQMLAFNPEVRSSTEDLLKSDIFDEIRIPELEGNCCAQIDKKE